VTVEDSKKTSHALDFSIFAYKCLESDRFFVKSMYLDHNVV